MQRKTIRRDVLKRRIAKGGWLARCLYRYTDDYAWDAAVKFGATDWLPARLGERGQWSNPSGAIVFSESDFRYSTGYAAEDESGTVTFAIHSNKVYELRPA